MKSRSLILLTLSLLLSLPLTHAQRVGDNALEFSLVDDAGNLVQLSDFLGTPLVLNVWASWCPPCTEELPLFERIYEDVNAGREDRVLGVLLLNNNEAPEQALRFLREELAVGLPVAVDATKEQRDALGVALDSTADVVRDYRVRGLPTTFFIDAAGVIQGVKVGFLLPAEAAQFMAGIGVDWQP